MRATLHKNGEQRVPSASASASTGTSGSVNYWCLSVRDAQRTAAAYKADK